MRKQLNRLFAFILFFPALSFATANVSGKLSNPSPSDTTIWQNAESHLDLHNCGGNYPVVPGASINSHQVYAISTTDGTWSGTLYRNDEISCNGAFTTWWTLTYWSNGRMIGPSRDLLINSSDCAVSCALDGITPITVYPTIAAPTGDNTYLRLDGGNQLNPYIFVNDLSVGGSLSAKRPNHFSDCSNSAFANTAACQTDAGTARAMLFPFGYSIGTFTNSNDVPVLDLTKPTWRGPLYASDFGLVGDNSTDNTTAFNAVASYACSIGFATIQFPIGRFMFNTAPNHIGCGLKLVGQGSRGSNDLGGTNLIANYNEASEFNGFLEWDGSYLGFSGCCNGTGGGLQHIQVSKNTGKTGGTGIMLAGTGVDCSSNRAGHMNFTDVLISSGNQTGTWQHTVAADGSCASTHGSAGIRDVEWDDVWFNDATVTDQTIYCKTCVHWHFSGGEVYAGTGSASGITVTGASGADQFSDDVHFDNLAVFGNLVWDYARNSSFNGHLTSASSTTANSQNIYMIGNFDAGAPVITACGSACGYAVNVAGNPFLFLSAGFFNASVTAKGAINATADGTTAAASNGDLGARRTSTTGFTFYGDGSCFSGMNGAATGIFNCGNSGIFNFQGTSTQVQLNAKLLFSAASPTISSGFGTSPSITNNNGTAAFTINVGTGGSATSGVIGLPTAPHGWVVNCQDNTTFSTTVFLTRQTATSTTTATVGAFNTGASSVAWVSADVLQCTAVPY